MVSTDKGNKGRFELSGDIEAKRKSEYIQKELERTKELSNYWKYGTFAAGVLLIATIVGFSLYNKTLKESVSDMEQKLVQRADSNSGNEELVVKYDSLLKENIKLQRDVEILVESSGNLDGVFFEVQIGSFTDFDLDNYLQRLAHLRQEKYDGKTKLLLGRFRSFRKALLFENDLKKIGMKSVFVVGRIDGKLVPYKEALEEYQRRK